MKKILCVIFWLASISAIAQSVGNIVYEESTGNFLLNGRTVAATMPYKAALVQNPNEIILDVNAMFNAMADSYLAIFHISQVGSTAREADSLINLRISAFRKAAVKVGVRESNFVTDMLSMLPVYEMEMTKKVFSKSYQEVPAGFEIQKNIHVKFENVHELDDLITAAAINEIYDLVKVDYYVADVEAVYDSLRKKATALLNERIKQYQSLGVQLEGQWRIAGDQAGVYFPLDRYASYQSNAVTSIESTKKKSSVTQRKRPMTYYYNKIPYSGFDVVFNPEIVEPAVQYTYNLQVKFTLEKKKEEKKEPELKAQNHYWIITPEGMIKELPFIQ